MLPSDPALAVRWLAQVRRGVVAVQLLLMLGIEAGTDAHVHPPALVGILVALGGVDLLESAWVRRRGVPPWLPAVHGAVDLLALTGILALSGGIRNPLVAAYLVYVTLFAVVLPAPRAWAVTVAATLLHAVSVGSPGHVRGLEPETLPVPHVVGHMLAFALSAFAVTWLVSRVSTALRARELAEREAQRRAAATERLAALGTLAAGVAHELGTPLGTIQLLAEDRDPARMDDLLLEVDRCRSILDRLRAAEAPEGETCTPDVAGWVAEWRRAAPEVGVELRPGGAAPAVRGAAAGWRAAVWVALDNARRAGARRVMVEVDAGPTELELRVVDDGAGLSADEALRSGEPFRTGWGGTGLGLFVSRSFARSVGGDVELAPGGGGGAVATVRMPRVRA